MTLPHLDSGHISLIITNVGFAVLAFARHMPAPKQESVLYAWVFDSCQDLCKNNDRIGLRRIGPNQIDPATGNRKETP